MEPKENMGKLIQFPVQPRMRQQQEKAERLRQGISSADYEAERSFEKDEILGLVYAIAEQEQTSKDELSVGKEFYDASGRLVGLIVQVSDGKAHGKGWGSIRYNFMPAGNYLKYSSDLADSSNTWLIREHGSLKDPNDIVAVGCVGRYEHGRWILDPNDMMMEMSAVERIDPEK